MPGECQNQHRTQLAQPLPADGAKKTGEWERRRASSSATRALLVFAPLADCADRWIAWVLLLSDDWFVSRHFLRAVGGGGQNLADENRYLPPVTVNTTIDSTNSTVLDHVVRSHLRTSAPPRSDWTRPELILLVVLLSAVLLCRIERSSAFSTPSAVAGPCAPRRRGFDAAAARRASNSIGAARLGAVASSRAAHSQMRRSVPSRPSLSTALLRSGASDDNEAGPFVLAASCASLAAQPVVWISLYFVATTGAGLPSGPLGLLGALEGISYLVVVGFVGASLYQKVATGGGLPARPGGMLGAAEGLSYLSLLGGLLVLAGLVVDEGCVPNARPILDYSEYLPVCSDKPGLFGE